MKPRTLETSAGAEGLRSHLIREDATAVYGDKGYASEAKKRAVETAGVTPAAELRPLEGECRQRRRPGFAFSFTAHEKCEITRIDTMIKGSSDPSAPPAA